VYSLYGEKRKRVKQCASLFSMISVRVFKRECIQECSCPLSALRLTAAIANPEDIRRQVDTRIIQTLNEFRTNSRRTNTPDDFIVFKAGLLEGEDFRHRNHFTFHTLYFGDGG